MFSEIIKLKYPELKEKYPDIKNSDNVSKVITMNNRKDIDSFSNKSDILLYYDVTNDELLTLVERLEKSEADISELEKQVDEFNSQHVDYVASVKISEEYIDLTIVHSSLANIE